MTSFKRIGLISFCLLCSFHVAVVPRAAARSEADRAPAIEVEDRGQGIPAALRERAFMPFVRLAEDGPKRLDAAEALMLLKQTRES